MKQPMAIPVKEPRQMNMAFESEKTRWMSSSRTGRAGATW